MTFTGSSFGFLRLAWSAPEFVLEWAPPGGPLREIVRQQWNFNPEGANSEVEDYHVDLKSLSVLQLTINPDITHALAPASLSHWRVA